MLYTCVWDGNAYTNVRIFDDFYNHLPLSTLQRGVSPGQILLTPNFVLMQAHFSCTLYNELLISVTYLVCAVCLTDTANNVFAGKDRSNCSCVY